MLRSPASILILALACGPTLASEVKVRVVMPETCSPTVSPAVVSLEPVGGPTAPSQGTTSATLALVNQRGLQFEPRVQVVGVGQTIQFTNQDAETHNVHILTEGYKNLSRSMKPNEPLDVVAARPGVIRLVCDIHSHMRGYVVVAATPWAKICKAGQPVQFADVPEGRYTLTAWHEMGEPSRREVEIKGAGEHDLGTITLKGPAGAGVAMAAAPIRPWPEVIDRIGVCLAEARAVVRKSDGLQKARKLAEDAYGVEFELSGMEAAVRRYLGVARYGMLQRQFFALRAAMKSVADGQADPGRLTTLSGKLLMDLSRAADDLKQVKIFSVAEVGAAATQAAGSVEVSGTAEQSAQLESLAGSFRSIRSLADRGQAADAASALFDAYATDFEPLERLLVARLPSEVAPLEARFITIRGRVESGLHGQELQGELDGLRSEVVAALARSEASSAGSFGPAFFASLVTILREGVEVILLLAMLVALVAKAGQPRAMVAIRWGVGAAAAASLVTAVALNLLVASARGTTREIVEGSVLMAAAGVLFYVSYWLISQTQAKKWADFLKHQVARGAQAGGLGTLAVTAFLAVYREGAETALMYQAMIAGQGGAREGLLGVLAGLLLGVVALGAVAWAIRSSSVRLPLRPFFKVTGWMLFAMAVVFAGNGVFELQSAGIIRVTPVSWLGLGLPVIGLHPNVQALSIQGILLMGAVLAVVLPMLEGRPAAAESKVKLTIPPAAGVGA